MRRLVANAGEVLPAAAINHRFIRVLGEFRRREFLIIYAEDLELTGLSTDQDADDKSRSEKRLALEQETFNRALASFSIVEG